MPQPLAIVAALPREIAGLVRGTIPDPELLRSGIHLYRLGHVVVVAAGMGAERVTFAVEAALSEPVAELISVGLAGGCVSSMKAGDVAEAGLVIDTRTGERFATAAHTACVLVTTDAVAGIAEKARLAAAYSASIVDMEAATVARLAAAHGLRFRAIKAVSDAHDFEVVQLARFTGERGSFRTGVFVLYTALRPHTWGAVIRLGRESGRALAALTARLQQVIDADDLS